VRPAAAYAHAGRPALAAARAQAQRCWRLAAAQAGALPECAGRLADRAVPRPRGPCRPGSAYARPQWAARSEAPTGSSLRFAPAAGLGSRARSPQGRAVHPARSAPLVAAGARATRVGPAADVRSRVAPGDAPVLLARAPPVHSAGASRELAPTPDAAQAALPAGSVASRPAAARRRRDGRGGAPERAARNSAGPAGSPGPRLRSEMQAGPSAREAAWTARRG
jgi:hypothetical protein